MIFRKQHIARRKISLCVRLNVCKYIYMSGTRRCASEKVLDKGERGITTKASIAFYSHPLLVLLQSLTTLDIFSGSRKSFEKASNAKPLSEPTNPMIPRKPFGVPVYDYSFWSLQLQ